MKKKLITVLLCLTLGLAATACGAGKDKGSSDAGDAGQETTVDKDFSLAMTDTYTYTDPQDLNFDQRFVLKGDESCKLLSDMKNFGYTATNVYQIIYAKDGEGAAEYDYYVTPDEASAQALAQFYTSQGQQVTQEGNVLYSVMDGDTLQATIITLSSLGAMSGDTVEDYAEMMKSSYGLTDY